MTFRNASQIISVMTGSIQAPESVVRAHKEAIAARLGAHAPYSKFQVGAALISSNGTIISGCNIENASYGATVCAERVAIWKAVSQGEKGFSDVIVVTDAEKPAFPCALCLQVMAEFCSPDTRIWIANSKEILSSHQFRELLPHPFGPSELGAASTAIN